MGQVLLAAPRGYCAGVDRAIAIVERALDTYGPPVHVRHQIVHNTYVVKALSDRGAIFVDQLEEVPDGAVVVFSAHGVSPAVREEAARRELEVIDGTCPLVAKVHQEARRFARDGYDILLVGHAGHEEAIGTLGEAPDRIQIVDGDVDVTVANPDKVAWLSQTTLAADDVDETVAQLRQRFPLLQDPPSDDICYASQNRQDGVKVIAPRCDLLLVVGSTNSSNSLRLVEVGLQHGAQAAYLIDRAADIDDAWFAGVTTVGVTAGASAPEILVQEVLEDLAARGHAEVEHVAVTEENVLFALPSSLAGKDRRGSVDER